MRKQILSILLCALLLTSCGNTTLETNSETDADLHPEETATITEGYYGLEAQDFGGVTFTIANREKSANYNAHPNPELDAPELNGEALNDGIYNRNLKLQEKYNILLESVTFTGHDQIANEIKKAVTSGDATYDAAFPGVAMAFQMAMNGHLYEIHDIPHLQTERSWWMTNVIENTSIGGRNFIIAGDMNIGAMNAAGIVYFNKSILTDYDLKSPYGLVDEGK